VWAGGGLYHEWVVFLDRWAAGEQVDPAGLPPVSPEDFTGDGFERLTNRLTAALSQRLTAWAEALTNGTMGARDEFTVARALGHAKWGLRPIRALAAHAGLPAELSARLLDAVDGQVHSAQQSLEDQVETMRRNGVDRRAVEARLRTVRDNALSAVTTERPAGQPAAVAGGWSTEPSTSTHRRVIVDRTV
jgi:hypothetical protein